MKKQPLIETVIYDLDGVLLDTEPIYTQVTQAIVGRWGKVFDWSVKQHMIGRRSMDSARFLVDRLELPISAEEYLELRQAGLDEGFARAPAIAGAEAFSRAFHKRGVLQGIATSSERPQFELKSSAHTDWFSIFSTAVTGDDPRVGEGKPAPDIFLVAAAELGTEPERCLVIEDSPAGVEAALAAGMRVIAIPDARMDRARYSGADLIVGAFDEVAIDELPLASSRLA